MLSCLNFDVSHFKQAGSQVGTGDTGAALKLVKASLEDTDPGARYHDARGSQYEH